MIDQLLNIGSAFDWITPTIAFIQDFLNGPIGDFGIPANPYWGRKEIKYYLNSYGIPVWGLMYNLSGDLLIFTVPLEDAELTFYLLDEAGIPIYYAPIDFVNTVA